MAETAILLAEWRRGVSELGFVCGGVEQNDGHGSGHVAERSVKHAVRWDDFEEGAPVCNTAQSCHELDLSHKHACTCEERYQVRKTDKTEKK